MADKTDTSEGEETSIRVAVTTRDRLQEYKEHPNVPNDEIIVRLMDIVDRHNSATKARR